MPHEPQTTPPIARMIRDRTEWTSLAGRIARARDGLYFSRRLRFDEALRPFLESGGRITYPDAIYYVTEEDFERAKRVANVDTWKQ